jgi:ribonucleoside-triphosphate reductase
MLNCHDCKKQLELDDKEDLIDAVQLKYKDGEKEIFVFKCNECYGKSQSLNNFRTCEVFSRVCGYFRPIQQYNIGKKQEYDERKNFKYPEDLST